MSGLEPIAPAIESPSSPPRIAPAVETSARQQSRFVRYIVRRGWIHLALITGVGIFLFPFIYMFGTSMKTDEELTQSTWFPSLPSYVVASPYVRATPAPSPPPEAPAARWNEVLPQLRTITR